MKTIAEWLQTDDQMCMDIVDRKYLLEEDILGHKESVDELLDRVSGGNKEARKLIEEELHTLTVMSMLRLKIVLNLYTIHVLDWQERFLMVEELVLIYLNLLLRVQK